MQEAHLCYTSLKPKDGDNGWSQLYSHDISEPN